jgi:LysM repeat protein
LTPSPRLLALGLVLAVLATLLPFAPRAVRAQEFDLPLSIIVQVILRASDESGLATHEVEIVRAELVEWTEDCAEQLGTADFCVDGHAQGYAIWVRAGDEAYRYHTDLSGNVVHLAEKGIDPPAVPEAEPPGSGELPTTAYTVDPGETLGEIAARFRTTVAEMAALNHLATPDLIYAGDILLVPLGPYQPRPGAEEVHVVKRGETLAMIAQRIGTTWPVLAEVNALANPNLIFEGQRLVLPRVAAETEPAEAEPEDAGEPADEMPETDGEPSDGGSDTEGDPADADEPASETLP